MYRQEAKFNEPCVTFGMSMMLRAEKDRTRNGLALIIEHLRYRRQTLYPESFLKIFCTISI